MSAANAEVLTPACKRCRYWSAWLPGHGDCMEYAEARQLSMIREDDPAKIPPARPAQETDEDFSCGKFAEIEKL